MSTINHGMNVDEVEALGRLLQSKADQLRHLTGEVESTLARTIWDGPDAAAFKQQWWPDHRGRLQAVAEQIHGFGQSALNNASEQRQASGVVNGGGSGAAAAVDVVGGAAAVVGNGGGSSTAGAGAAGQVATPGGQYAPLFTDGSSWTDDWKNNGGMDQWNFGYDDSGGKGFGDCTSFVAWRLNQLGRASGHDSYDFTNNHLRLGDGSNVDFGRLGNAYEWYGHAPEQFRSTMPHAGSVLVWEQGDGKAYSGGDFGHVAVVREVRPDGSIVIEESSYDGYTYKQVTLAPGAYPKKFLNFLP